MPTLLLLRTRPSIALVDSISEWDATALSLTHGVCLEGGVVRTMANSTTAPPNSSSPSPSSAAAGGGGGGALARVPHPGSLVDAEAYVAAELQQLKKNEQPDVVTLDDEDDDTTATTAAKGAGGSGAVVSVVGKKKLEKGIKFFQPK